MSDLITPTSVGSTNDGIAAAAMYAATSKNSYDGSGDWFSFLADSVRQIDRDVSDTKADIRETIHNQSLKESGDTQMLLKTMADNTLALHNRLCESEKAAMRAEYEAKLATQTAIKEINEATQHRVEVLQSDLRHEIEEVDHAVEEAEEKVTGFQEETLEEFCNVNRRIAAGFSHAREEDLENEVEELRAQLAAANVANLVGAKKV